METSSSTTSTSSAALWLLPPELLNAIMEDLSWVDLIHLWKSSLNLARRLEPKLFGTPAALNRTMLLACTRGEVPLIRCAVSHGADVSVVNVHRCEFEQFPRPGKEVYPVSTLVFAAKKRYEEAFTLLLHLGATIERRSHQQLRALAKVVTRPGCESMLLQVLDNKLGSRMLDAAGIKLNLVTMIQRGASIDLLEIMMDHGADPNNVVPSKKSHLNSPLSIAIEMGSRELFEMLIRRGADIHGWLECSGVYRHSRRRFHYDRPNHIPIFAAISRMARTGLRDMVDLCLYYGADINMKAPAFLTPHPMFPHYQPRYVSIRPFWTYLESIASRMIGNIFEVRDAIDYLAGKGADLRLAELETSHWPWLPVATGRHSGKLSEAGLFLFTREPRKLQQNRFFGVIDYLEELQTGVDVGPSINVDDLYQRKMQYRWWQVAKLQIKMSFTNYPHNFRWFGGIYRLPMYIWMMVARAHYNQVWKDAILSNVILYMSSYPDHFTTYDWLVLDQLEASGADINGFLKSRDISKIRHLLMGDPMGPRIPGCVIEWPDEQCAHRPLYGVFEKINSIYVGNIKPGTRIQQWDSDNIKGKLKSFCLALIQQGANPYLLVDDMSAIDVLTQDLDMAEEPARQYITELAQAVRDAFEMHFLNGSTTNETRQSVPPQAA